MGLTRHIIKFPLSYSGLCLFPIVVFNPITGFTCNSHVLEALRNGNLYIPINGKWNFFSCVGRDRAVCAGRLVEQGTNARPSSAAV